MADFPLVIPLHKRGGKFRDDTEARLAIRSIERHFKGGFHLAIVAEKLPDWATGIELIPDGGKGLKTALLRVAERFPNGFFWWYDDCVLLKDQSPLELRVTPACKGWMTAKTPWARNLDTIRERLLAEGHKAIDFSRPHGPYWFTKAMIDEAFADWPQMAGKFPFESWILSKRGWPRRHGVVKQYYGPFKGPPFANAVFLNFNDPGFTQGLKTWLEMTYDVPSSFEKKPREGMVEVHTIRFGDRWWMRLCKPTLDAWAERHGYPLHVWGEQPQYPEAKYCQIDMLRGFLERDAEWCVYVDSDVYVSADAPALGAMEPGYHIREDLPGGGPRDFLNWCRRNRIKPPAGWIYRNAGVWACDREAAQQMLAVAKPPFRPGCQEQHQWNHWLAESGVRVVGLDRRWNAWCHENEPGWFSHIAGRRKVQRLETFRSKGFIPRDTTIAAPCPDPAFDFEPYRFTIDATTAPTDEFHVHMLRRALDKAGKDLIAVEIGSWRGTSTAAFIDAINAGVVKHLHIFEVSPKPEIYRVIALCHSPERVTLHQMPSWDVANPVTSADFVFIDGNHTWPAIADTLQAMAWGAKVIAMHDTREWPKAPECWGTFTAAGILKRAAGREWVEDFEERPGMRTQRGLGFSIAHEKRTGGSEVQRKPGLVERDAVAVAGL
jgi:hypothetical protein